jgi:SAM-dependent methyltransferase
MNSDTRESPTLVVGSRSDLESVGRVPELLEIDREIDRPIFAEPLVYNSQTWSRLLELPWIIRRLGPPSGLSVLDVGSGVSALPIYLARHGAKVISVDPQVSLGLPAGVIRVRAALPHLPFRDTSFDVVCCVSVIEHLPFDVDLYYSELTRVARNRVIITFDVAKSPLAVFGLSRVEMRALAHAVGKRVVFPEDRLKPSIAERKAWIVQTAVCLLEVIRTDRGWPAIHLSTGERRRIRFHRWVRDVLMFVRNRMLKLRRRLTGK